MRTFTTACVAALLLAGCADRSADVAEATLARMEAENAADEQRWQEDFDRASRRMRECFTVIGSLRIGVDFYSVTETLPCKPDRMNTTETTRGKVTQLVYESVGYLYFTNGVLTARQIAP